MWCAAIISNQCIFVGCLVEDDVARCWRITWHVEDRENSLVGSTHIVLYDDCRCAPITHPTSKSFGLGLEL
jgi:hypothetical protein